MDPQPQHTPPHSFQPIKKHSGPIARVGKIVLFFLIAIVLLLGGYYLGIQTNPVTVTPRPTPIQSEPTATSTPIPPTPTPASQNTKALKAGISSISSFTPYTIDVPTDWTDVRETTITGNIDKLTLEKNGYSITIYQASVSGGGCIYPKDKAFSESQLFTDYADINGRNGQYRRSWIQKTGQTITYTICQKGTDGLYSDMTTFGEINVVSPSPANASMLTEIDGMIASLIKQ